MAALNSAGRINKLLDPLTAVLSNLRRLLDTGSLRSIDLIDAYLAQIEKHNDYLRAVASIAPVSQLREFAEACDQERDQGRGRGPLHGIPVLIKDTIGTKSSLGMETTAGSYALKGAQCPRNADVVDRLVDAGAIIIGKTTLSELSFYKGTKLSCGWSALYGQSQSAYVRGGVQPDDTFAGHSNPGGSSSGSAISVSAGFAPVAIGAETDGSIVMPSNRAALYSMKPTVGLVSPRGAVPINPLFDTIGPMAKNAVDVGIMLDVIVEQHSQDARKNVYAEAASNKSWKNLRVGVLDPEVWHQPGDMIKPAPGALEQACAEINAAYDKLQPLTKALHRNIDLVSPSTVVLDGRNAMMESIVHDYKPTLDKYLAELQTSPVKSVEELIRFNENHADKELPEGNSNQDILIKASTSVVDDDEFAKLFSHMRMVGRSAGIDKALKDYNIDAIIGPADSQVTKLASASGYPIATMPLSYLAFNGRPFGLVALAQAGQEELLLQILGAWEATFPSRIPPPMLETIGQDKGLSL